MARIERTQGRRDAVGIRATGAPSPDPPYFAKRRTVVARGFADDGRWQVDSSRGVVAGQRAQVDARVTHARHPGMTPATRYDLVVLLHVSADLVFVLGLLAATLALAALSLQDASELAMARTQRLAEGLRRWHRAVTTSALALAWTCGVWLALQAGWFHSGWLQFKLGFVIALSALHGASSLALRRACAPTPIGPQRAWLAAPALTLACATAALWLAWMKPF